MEEVAEVVQEEFKSWEFFLTPEGTLCFTHKKPVVHIVTNDDQDYQISFEKFIELAPYFKNMWQNTVYNEEKAPQIGIPVSKNTFMLLTYTQHLKSLGVDIDNTDVWEVLPNVKTILKELAQVTADDALKVVRKSSSRLPAEEFNMYCKILTGQKALDDKKLEAFKCLYLSLLNLPKKAERQNFLKTLHKQKINQNYFMLPSDLKLENYDLKEELGPLLAIVLWKRFQTPTNSEIIVSFSDLGKEYDDVIATLPINTFYLNINRYYNHNYNNANEKNRFVILRILGLLDLLHEMKFNPTKIYIQSNPRTFTINGLLTDRYQ